MKKITKLNLKNEEPTEQYHVKITRYEISKLKPCTFSVNIIKLKPLQEGWDDPKTTFESYKKALEYAKHETTWIINDMNSAIKKLNDDLKRLENSKMQD
jgi:hypothetical protein